MTDWNALYDELSQLEAKATRGQWFLSGDNGIETKAGVICNPLVTLSGEPWLDWPNEHDLSLIIRSRNALPLLLKRMRALEKVAEQGDKFLKLHDSDCAKYPELYGGYLKNFKDALAALRETEK